MYNDNQQSDFDFNKQSNANQSAYQPPPPAYQPPPYQSPQYQPPPQQYNNMRQWPPMTVGDWVITWLLLLIPIANIVLVFMWAFGSDVNPSKKTYFQAYLILIAIAIVLSIFLSIVAGAFLATLFTSLGNVFY